MMESKKLSQGDYNFETGRYFLWELDHITPLSKAKTEEEVLKLAHYLNIQPLWILDNRSKGNK